LRVPSHREVKSARGKLLVQGVNMKRALVGVGSVLSILLFAPSVFASSIKEELESKLFGGPTPSFFTIADTPLLSADPEQFGTPILAIGSVGSVVTKAMRDEILSESAVVPVPSGSAGFAYTYNPNLNVFERRSIGLGTVFNERVTTLGKGIFTFGLTYIRQDFDEFNGDDISNLRVRRGLFARSPFLGTLVESGEVDATLDLDVTTNSVAIWATYGLADWLDVSFLLPVTVIDLRARSTIRQASPTLRADLPAFLPDSQCTLERAAQNQCSISDFILLRQGTRFAITERTDVVDETRSGVGDLLLRTKARFFEGAWGAAGGITEFTFPSGEKDNFLGDGAFKARFLLLYSQSLFANRLNFHLNGGGKVTTETSRKNTLEYGSSVDLMVTERLSLIAELIGSWRVDAEGLPDNFIDGAFGFKANLFRGLIASASFRIPATDDGLRSDLIYLAGLEYDF
jgi:hypothetical protein